MIACLLPTSVFDVFTLIIFHCVPQHFLRCPNYQPRTWDDFAAAYHVCIVYLLVTPANSNIVSPIYALQHGTGLIYGLLWWKAFKYYCAIVKPYLFFKYLWSESRSGICCCFRIILLNIRRALNLIHTMDDCRKGMVCFLQQTTVASVIILNSWVSQTRVSLITQNITKL